jgi:dihydroxy-acid dehydratase
MHTGSWHGVRLGACTDCRRFWSEHRAGSRGPDEIAEVRENLATTAGTCAVMGTASTMACVSEALGMMLLGGAAAPAPTGARLRHAALSGRKAVALAKSGVRPAGVLSRESFLNAVTVLAALSGSTNAIVHLLAIAGRAGVRLTLDDFDTVARRVPLLVDCKPAGAQYMEDFHNAGGVPTLLKALTPLLELSSPRVDGCTLGEALRSVDSPAGWQTCIRTLDDPLGPPETLAVLRGNLAPDGAVLKTAAASKHLLSHRGPALVFESPDDAARRLDDPALEVTENHVLVLRNAGPAAAGMPESGSLPIPRKLAESGVRDMVRISDARMSGTAFGTVVLHCSPAAARGGPLSRIRDGDVVSLDVPARRLDVLVDEREWQARTPAPAPAMPERGWRRLYAEHVQGAHLGADLDFLTLNGER